tara:strand:+ start:277 stop:1884 length:1608 start_codon:yes stop_codon:yes gene_type:complete
MSGHFFIQGFDSAMRSMLYAGRYSRNLAEDELDKEKLEIARLPFEDLQESVESGDATSLETETFASIKEKKYAADINQLTYETSLRTSELQGSQLNRAFLSDAFGYLTDVATRIESEELKRGTGTYDAALDIAVDYFDKISDDGYDLYETISPKYVKAIKSAKDSLALLQAGNPEGLTALQQNVESLNVIFKPKTTKYFGKEFVSEDGNFSGTILDVDINLADTQITENAESVIVRGKFTVRDQNIYKASIDAGESKEQAEAKSTRVFDSFMPDITTDIIKQSNANKGDAVQVSVKDMVDFAGSNIQLVTALLQEGNPELFKFVAEAKENSYRKTNVLDAADIADINVKAAELFADSYDANRDAFIAKGGLNLLNKIKRNPNSKSTAFELRKILEALGPKRNEFTKFIEDHPDKNFREEGLKIWTGGQEESSIFNAYINTFPSKADIRADLMAGQDVTPNPFPAVPQTETLTFRKGTETFEISTANVNTALTNLESKYGKDFLDAEIATIKNVAKAKNIELQEKEILFLLQKTLR